MPSQISNNKVNELWVMLTWWHLVRHQRFNMHKKSTFRSLTSRPSRHSVSLLSSFKYFEYFDGSVLNTYYTRTIERWRHEALTCVSFCLRSTPQRWTCKNRASPPPTQITSLELKRLFIVSLMTIIKGLTLNYEMWGGIKRKRSSREVKNATIRKIL